VAQTRTFRIFVSSTFEDMVAERDVLHRFVFPRLRELCRRYGAHFQPIDLRWGVSEEAGEDQRTLPICLDEVDRCRKLSCGPNFIAFLGDRYGWRPLPSRIPATEFAAVTEQLSPDEYTRLGAWYERDDNAVPAEYALRSRHGRPEEDPERWQLVERDLRELLARATAGMELPEERRRSYAVSATEHEVCRGVLDDPDAHEHAIAFLRTIRDLPAGPEAYPFRDVDPAAVAMLDALKDRLRAHLGGGVVEYTVDWTSAGPTTDQLGELPESLDECLALAAAPADPASPGSLCLEVFRRLATMINDQIEQLAGADQLDTEIATHDAFGAERAASFIGRSRALSAILDHLTAGSERLLGVFGPSGSGKSALLAQAARLARADNPRAAVIVRFIGATPASSDARALLASLCQELSRHYGADPSSIPTDYGELVKELSKRLALATPDRPAIVLLDALNLLPAAERARNLPWLPARLPAAVRIVVSTIPGDCLDALRRKGPEARLLELEPMPDTEAESLLKAWLTQAHRTLRAHQLNEVLSKFATEGLPLYLKLAFEEARLWRSSADPAQTTIAQGIPGIIRDNLQRRLSAPAHHGPLLVSRALAYLAASRNGLAEDELVDILSRDQQVFAELLKRTRSEPPDHRLPAVVWSRLRADLEPYLTEQAADGANLLGFYHRQFSEVIAEDHLAGSDGSERHAALVRYFDSEREGTRWIDELPWQLARVRRPHAWSRLRDLLLDPGYLESAWRRNEFDVKSFWVDVEANSALRLTDAYRLSLGTLPRSVSYWLIVAQLLRDTGHADDALSLYRLLAGEFRRSGEHENLARSLGWQASIFSAQGDLAEAMRLLKEEEEIYRQLGTDEGLQATLGDQAVVLWKWGRPADAMVLLRTQEALCRELGDVRGLRLSIGNQALCMERLGEHDKALALHVEEESMCRESGDQDALERALGNHAAVLIILERHEDALALLEEQERICRRIGDRDGLQRSLGNQASVFATQERREEAKALLREQERLCRDLGARDGLQAALGNQAVLLMKMGEASAALQYAREAEQLCREMNAPHELETCLSNQARMLLACDREQEALALLKEQESLCRKFEILDSLSQCLGAQASILDRDGNVDGALALLREQEVLCRRLGDDDGLQHCLGERARIYVDMGNPDRALAPLLVQEQICRKLQRQDALQRSLGDQALVWALLGMPDKAIEAFEEQHAIARGLGDPTGAITSLVGQGLLRSPPQATALLMEARRLAVQAGMTELAGTIDGWIAGKAE
jgi:tetratricopeptide (TPR) repeat protein